MYHPPSKQRQVFMRILVYSGMTLAVFLLVSVLVYYMLGYRYNQSEGMIVQNGLVQYDSTPDGATIEVDGVTYIEKTPAKGSVSPGNHEFVMWREGYETWRKNLNIDGGTLTWLNYARLVPKKLPVEKVATLPKAAASLAAPGGRFMAVLPSTKTPTVDFYDLQAVEVERTSLTLDETDYSAATDEEADHKFELIEWDLGGRYLLLRHDFNSDVEWLIIDRDDLELKSNLTKIMDIDASKVHFSGTSGDVFFVLSRGDIREVNLDDGTLSRPLAVDVAEFTMYGDNLASFVSTYDKETKQRVVGFVRDGADEPIILMTSTSPPQTPLHVRLTNYFNQDFVVISEGKEVKILAGAFPASTERVETSLSQFDSFMFASDVQWLLASTNGRFIVAQNGASYVGYDLERETLSPLANIPGEASPSKLDWLDDYYVWSDRSGSLTMSEYDGANRHAINSVVRGFDATLSPNGIYLYTIGRTNDGFQLQRVKMVLG